MKVYLRYETRVVAIHGEIDVTAVEGHEHESEAIIDSLRSRGFFCTADKTPVWPMRSGTPPKQEQ